MKLTIATILLIASMFTLAATTSIAADKRGCICEASHCIVPKC
jgi:hypothetical protein